MRFAVVLFLVLSACGSSGGSGAAAVVDGRAPGIPATCKSLYSSWQSANDSERHDFTALANSVVEQEYGYVAGDNATCGYVTNPGHNLTAQMVATSGGNHQWSMNMVASLAMVGTCATYTPPGSIGNRYSNLMIRMPSCDVLEICIPYGLGTCKTFN
jgi:hypothetical protein